MERVAISYRAVWAALAEDWSAVFSEEVRTANTPTEETTLCECLACGLEYFVPVEPGDAGFYAELMSSVDYEDTRWDFHVASWVLPRGGSLVDFGCGRGAFLKMVDDGQTRVVGVDQNEDVRPALAGGGIEFFCGTPEAFASQNQTSFDIASAFQLLEHLPDATALMEPAVNCLRPGGMLLVSVPNRRRRIQGLEALDCPPHHLSRWSPEHFRVLAQRFGLILRSVHCQRLPVPWQSLVEPVASASHRKKPRLGGSLGARLESLAWRTGPFGHTMLARFEVPDEPRG